jgi:16S rRNA (uracil1498-N3)-methyltransferase
MPDRYFLEAPPADDRTTISGAEAHHLLHVMRAKVGQEVVVFDGSGWEYVAKIEKLGRADVQLAVLSRAEVNRELPLRLVLGVALPKGDRQKWLVEKATEVGVSELVPLGTARGVAQPVDSALDRLRRSVIEASKQCGRNQLMHISQPQPLAEYLAASPDATRLFAHPGGQALAALSERLTASREVRIAVGPEGGFTDDELALAGQAGWLAVDLGARILRVETAALVLAALAGSIAPES